MNEETIQLIEQSFEALKPQGEALVARFYERLFQDFPQVRPLFSENMDAQRTALLGALVLAVGHLRKPEVLLPTLKQLGARHAGYGVEAAHYGAVRDTMLAVMGELAGGLWTDELAAAWGATLDVVGNTMLEGAAEA